MKPDLWEHTYYKSLDVQAVIDLHLREADPKFAGGGNERGVRGSWAKLPLKAEHGRPRDFFQGGQCVGLKDISPSVGSRGRHFLKIMHKYFIYWDFRQHLQHENTLQHFHGVSIPPYPCLPSPMKLNTFAQLTISPGNSYMSNQNMQQKSAGLLH